MRSGFITLLVGVACLVALPSATGQVLWNFDFDSSTDLASQDQSIVWHIDDPQPIVTRQIINSGDPAHQNVLKFSVDTSANTNHWYCDWIGHPIPKTVPKFDREHTYLTFDLLVYLLKPVHAKITYFTDFNNVEQLETDVMPTVTGSFQRFTVPLSAFTATLLYGEPPNSPGNFWFGLHGDPALPDTTWPNAATNVFFADNIKYIVSPPLSIANLGEGVALSWPTNGSTFVLQQSSDLAATNWTPVTNSPSVINDQNQVLLSPVGGSHFYRLIDP